MQKTKASNMHGSVVLSWVKLIELTYLTIPAATLLSLYGPWAMGMGVASHKLMPSA